MSYISTADLAALSSPMSAYKNTTAWQNTALASQNSTAKVGSALEVVLVLATSLFGSLVLWTAVAGAWMQ